jgi:DNA-binding NarL/FixJ family response regulator
VVELLDAVERLRPGAVLTDIRMPPGHSTEGIEAAHAIRARHPEVGVVVLSQHAEETYAFLLLQHGTDGLAYLLKDRVGDLDELLRALKEVAAGRSVIDPRIVELLLARRARLADSALGRLSPREREVLQQTAEGKTNAAIARALVLLESAVEKHTNAIFSKLGLAEEPQVHHGWRPFWPCCARRVTNQHTTSRNSSPRGAPALAPSTMWRDQFHQLIRNAPVSCRALLYGTGMTQCHDFPARRSHPRIGLAMVRPDVLGLARPNVRGVIHGSIGRQAPGLLRRPVDGTAARGVARIGVWWPTCRFASRRRCERANRSSLR